MNHGNTDDTGMVSGDEGGLTPIHDMSIDANNGLGTEEVVESTEVYSSPPDVVDESLTPTHEDQADEPQQADANQDWQTSAAEEPLASLETVSDEAQPQKIKAQAAGWQQVRNFFLGRSADGSARLDNLTRAIEDAPESPVNYVLRAELYCDLREYALAQADFQRAVELAETQFELADWGLLDQVMRDRALSGLEKVRRRLR